VDYEKAIRGNLLYIASQIADEVQDMKTVAYLYSIDNAGTGYFFTPTASNMLTGADTGAAWTNSQSNPNADYAANNGTIDLGYRATLPFITTTYDSGNPFISAGNIPGIIMAVEDIWKTNPACTVGDDDSLANVDVIIYNTTQLTSLAGTTGGRNSSGVEIATGYADDDFDLVKTWAIDHGFPDPSISTNNTLFVAGDDFATSVNQGFGTIDTTDPGMSPLLYCQRNYTADKNAKAAWAFAQVYPELYDNNPDATYGYWVDKIYHINIDDVPAVATYMLNKSVDVEYDAGVASALETNFVSGYRWWTTSGSVDPAWSIYAYYSGSSRASYYSGLTASEEPPNEIGIFEPSDFWTGVQ
jgi:hypothetical protein